MIEGGQAMKLRSIRVASLLILASLVGAWIGVLPAAGLSPKVNVDTPLLTAVGSTTTTLTVRFSAGPTTGAPAGFSIEAMTAADFFANNGWFASSDPRLCKAGFSGNGNLSPFSLGPNESADVTIGDQPSCALTCGTDYVIRAFAHATNTFRRSDYSDTLFASTSPCE
jgi:hypothetical protein